jgi:hypothetical protein
LFQRSTTIKFFTKISPITNATLTIVFSRENALNKLLVSTNILTISYANPSTKKKRKGIGIRYPSSTVDMKEKLTESTRRRETHHQQTVEVKKRRPHHVKV